MGMRNKDGSLKPTRQIIDESRKRDQQKKILLLNNQNFRMRGFIISDKEWWRLNHSIEKIKKSSPTGATKQIVVNNLFKEFNDKILGEGNDE